MDNPVTFERIYTINRTLLEECDEKLKECRRLSATSNSPENCPADTWENVRDRYHTLEKLIQLLLESGLPEDYCKEVSQRFDYQDALVRPDILDVEDFTFFLPREPASAASSDTELDPLEKFLWLRQVAVPRDKFSHDCKIWLWCPPTAQRIGRAAYGRALVCPCREGTEWSVTFRKIAEYPKQGKPASFLNETEEICGTIARLIFPQPGVEAHGLIVIAGRTGVAKSKVAQGLLKGYLRQFSGTERTSHLLTYEDPIEKYLEIDAADYTPREKGKDAAGISEVVNNALRQTPKALFVGETREQSDWRKLLEFAGTGHLVITTAHAGSLTEAMANLLRAAEAQDATERSEVADRVLALIHLRRDEVPLPPAVQPMQIAIPALWKRTPTGIKALMAEGLSALLPNNPKEEDAHQYSSIGRLWFARRLLKQRIVREQWHLLYGALRGFIKPPKKESLLSDKQNQKLETEVIKKALKWDLGGI